VSAAAFRFVDVLAAAVVGTDSGATAADPQCFFVSSSKLDA